MDARLTAGRRANALERDASGEYDVLADLAARHTGDEILARDEKRRAWADDVRALLRRVALQRDPADVSRLASLERAMSAADRAAFDREKRLLGLLDLLGEGWWGEV